MGKKIKTASKMTWLEKIKSAKLNEKIDLAEYKDIPFVSVRFYNKTGYGFTWSAYNENSWLPIIPCKNNYCIRYKSFTGAKRSFIRRVEKTLVKN